MVAAAFGVVLTQPGCATSWGDPRYPAEWASIRSAPTPEGCPDLQGIYRNQGSASFPREAGDPPTLADVFRAMAESKSPTGPTAWKQSWPALPRDADRVVFRQTPDGLTVVFGNAAGAGTALDFRRYRFDLSEDRVDDLFACRHLYGEPTLRFFNEPRAHTNVSVLVIGGGGTVVVLLKAVDGSLVVNWRSDDVTISRFVLGSGYRVANLWYRYPKVTDEGSPD